MKRPLLATLLGTLLLGQFALATDLPPIPKPTAEHTWLQKFVGEWDVETEIFLPGGQPTMKMKGSESARMLGGFWLLGDNRNEFMGQPFHGLMTLGFDPARGRYTGSWIDSGSPALWEYSGTLDAATQTLNLETSGFCPIENQVCQFRQRITFKSPDQRILTAERLGKDGQWARSMTITATRKK